MHYYLIISYRLTFAQLSVQHVVLMKTI